MTGSSAKSFQIFLPDGASKQFDHAPTGLEVAESISPWLAKDTLGVVWNDEKEVRDFREAIPNNTKVRIITRKDELGLEVIRHSAAHVMAQAVQELWPEVKVTIGPVIENGFYYDFDSPHTFTPENLVQIEEKMNELLKRQAPVLREEWTSEKAIATFEKMGENFKVEIIKGINSPIVGIYKQENWFDLCRGPHVQNIGQIKAIKVLSLAGAYWRGDEKNKQLQRVYATAFFEKKDLETYLHNLEEAKKRDHRKLGKELGLFAFHPFSPGAPFFTPRGTIIYNELLKLMRDKYIQYGYQEVITPQVFDVDLYHQSGHYANYRENMYFTKVDDRDFSLKPMNCPGHCLLYAVERKSYRELPWRIADFGRLHRHERSGVIHGLTRVRSFSQDDAHIFCRIDQLQEEIKSFMIFLEEVYQLLGLSQYKVFFSTRPASRMGSDEIWDRAEQSLQNALESLKIDFTLNPGDGAFYGPKLDIMFVDALGRPWQLGTLQCDFNMPEAFELKYAGEDNKDHRPVMLHRAILGSLERFIGVYLEHTAGRLPLWLSPVQVTILNVTDDQIEYCELLKAEGLALGLRMHWDDRKEKLGFKIREAQMQKIPYMLIVGEKEKGQQTVSVRMPSGENKEGISYKEFLAKAVEELQSRALKSWLTTQNP